MPTPSRPAPVESARRLSQQYGTPNRNDQNNPIRSTPKTGQYDDYDYPSPFFARETDKTVVEKNEQLEPQGCSTLVESSLGKLTSDDETHISELESSFHDEMDVKEAIINFHENFEIIRISASRRFLTARRQILRGLNF